MSSLDLSLGFLYKITSKLSEAQCSVLGTGRWGRGPEPVAASSAEGPSTCLPQVLKLGLLVQYWAWRQDILDTSSFEGWVDLGGAPLALDSATSLQMGTQPALFPHILSFLVFLEVGFWFLVSVPSPCSGILHSDCPDPWHLPLTHLLGIPS